jgi:magnesium-transporting ATPase (P-type)
MDNKIFLFLNYLIDTAFTDKNSFFILIFIVVGGYFAIRILWKSFPTILSISGYFLGFLFIALIITLIVFWNASN